jgi:UDP-N-acetylglucosamine 4,6-dehydratase
MGEGRFTITDARMTRFWITLDQAVDLVVYAFDHMVGGEIFIPKIPSMTVTDLAAAMDPDIPVEFIGIRPGEKLHESLLTVDESRHSIDAGEVFVVLPEHPWWEANPAWLAGSPLRDGFTYSSDTNEEWLSPDQLRTLLL